MTELPTPTGSGAIAWVRQHLGHLTAEGRDAITASRSFRGGQTAADAALAAFDVAGYASSRNEVWPWDRRGASRLSPYIRHGLLTLRQVWDHVGDGPARDRTKFRDELLWQEYARHLYCRLGERTREPLRYWPARSDRQGEPPWDGRMACIDLALTELQQDGWLVNQSRMWLASHWAVRGGWDWQAGEDAFFSHLLDGSRAANRLGWQWTVGTGTGRPYGFSRHQVAKRAPGLCQRCPLDSNCPIAAWPDAEPGAELPPEPLLRGSPGSAVSAGPEQQEVAAEPDAVWLTAESLGLADPAAAAYPGLPAVFVFDEPLLARLRLSGKRLVFLTETLSGIAEARPLQLLRGDPVRLLSGKRLAVTYAPVPGFARRAQAIQPVSVHPYPWLVRPHHGGLQSFSAWRKRVSL